MKTCEAPTHRCYTTVDLMLSAVKQRGKLLAPTGVKDLPPSPAQRDAYTPAQVTDTSAP